MPDPRNAVSFEGIGADYVTFKHDSSIVYDATKAGGSVSVGLAVKLVGASQVGLTTDGSSVDGKLQQVDPDGKCRIQTEGGTTLPAGNGATVTVGSKAVGALGPSNVPGYIRNGVAATAAEANAPDVRILDVTDTTKVWVDL